MNKLTKQAAARRLRKLASVAKIVKYDRAMKKLAGPPAWAVEQMNMASAGAGDAMARHSGGVTSGGATHGSIGWMKKYPPNPAGSSVAKPSPAPPAPGPYPGMQKARPMPSQGGSLSDYEHKPSAPMSPEEREAFIRRIWDTVPPGGDIRTRVDAPMQRKSGGYKRANQPAATMSPGKALMTGGALGYVPGQRLKKRLKPQAKPGAPQPAQSPGAVGSANVPPNLPTMTPGQYIGAPFLPPSSSLSGPPYEHTRMYVVPHGSNQAVPVDSLKKSTGAMNNKAGGYKRAWDLQSMWGMKQPQENYWKQAPKGAAPPAAKAPDGMAIVGGAPKALPRKLKRVPTK